MRTATQVGALLSTDLRLLWRSPRTLVFSVLVPLLVWPVTLLISQQVQRGEEDRRETTTYRYAIRGDGTASLRQILDRVSSDEMRLEELDLPDIEASLERDELHFWIDATSSAVPVYTIHLRGDRQLSRSGASQLSELLSDTRNDRRAALLLERGFPERLEDVTPISFTDTAPDIRSSGLQLGRFLTLMILLFLLVGGSVVASDSLAGEKERGTLETLLTTAITRSELVMAKLLGILVVAIAITTFQLLNLFALLSLGLLDLPEGFAVPITPTVAGSLLLLYVPVALLVSAALLLTSAYAKTYKEAQLYFFPVFLFSLLPAAAPIVPSLRLQSVLVLVPIANISLAVKDLLSGSFDWLWTLAAWVVTAVFAVGLAVLSTRTLTRENLITSADEDGVDAQRPEKQLQRHILWWAAVSWASILVAANFLGAEATLGKQLGFNFGLLTVVMVLVCRRYDVPLRTAFSLRLPHPAVWPAVLVGAPSALVLGGALARITSRALPVPETMLEEFERMLVPEDASTAGLLLLLALLPALVEEAFFRGVLLWGLRDRPIVRRVLLSAVVFSLYHVSFFRLLPTAYLGVLLAAVTLLSGSIYPAVLWHALNNGLAILIDMSVFTTSPSWIAIAVVGLGGCGFALWRSRRTRVSVDRAAPPSSEERNLQKQRLGS